MKKLSFASVATAVCAVALGLVATNASAAYSGYVQRQVCANGTFMASPGDSSYWIPSGCSEYVSDSANPSYYHYGVMAIPWEATSSQTATFYLPVTGAYSGYGNAYGCVTARSFDVNGNASSTNTTCTTGIAPVGQTLYPTVTVPGYGSVQLTYAAQHGFKVFAVGQGGTQNGT